MARPHDRPIRCHRHGRNQSVRTDLSVQTQQSFQVVALLATMLVVGIHYKSDIPDFPSPRDASWNQLAQEFCFGGLARVAVPLFALAAGLFYFRSNDGTLGRYRRQLASRARSIGVPYLLISSIAFACWWLAGYWQGRQLGSGITPWVNRWLLHPPAEQLWFLRDLMVLVVIAPVIRWSCATQSSRGLVLSALVVAWIANVQPFPIVAGWYLINVETLLFFTVGCVASRHPRWIEGLTRVSPMTVLTTTMVWWMLVATRITVKADFDLWYVTRYGGADLMLHQVSILVGCVALFMIAARLRHPWLIQLSGASFFVYLVHEYPLRPVLRQAADRILDHDISCWIVTPLVVAGCYAAAWYLSRRAPWIYQLISGGRSPDQATRRATGGCADPGGRPRSASTLRAAPIAGPDPYPIPPPLAGRG